MSNCEIARLLRNDPKTIHNESNPGTTLQQARKGGIRILTLLFMDKLFTKSFEIGQ